MNDPNYTIDTVGIILLIAKAVYDIIAKAVRK